ncbi:MAG: respiratory nitrate reductase subunit gamma [Gammaproteobacteria bacterium]|nr:respiratory nitrate reductase subunit gamma [Gammaproteobacteria bacterium]MCP5436381.1 respiratory nitrate reductase subunit gamma [Chromatiaceae bacterium]MCW5586091.1 respiratory nitrate reductase subunit gamma [Chromatiales bacterium]MCP5437027.1 respiratory nitrate reductase subunit gamma [Chromatiaceae bacterium]MCP5438871.1 respiratory nitrate reductase subunit gamma [Chromatiaceae bacterium]
MSFLTVAFAALFYAATLLLVVGLARRISLYWRTPAPLKIPTTPAPVTQGGVVLRMFREVVFFESLFKSTKWTWLFGWVFHMALFAVLFRHLRYFTEAESIMAVVTFVSPLFKYLAFAMIIGLLGLWGRRLFVDRVRYISAPSDHLMLLLLLLIGISGAMTTFVAHTDVVMVKAFFRSLMTFSFSDMPNLPNDPFIVVHLLLVAVLMIIFPISKLLHAPGVFFSPTRNQVDNPREQRHIADWARKLEQ